jgi:hypothetical protein
MSVPQDLTTQIELVGESTRFVIAASDRLYQDRLEHLGIGNDRCATAWFRNSPSVPQYYQRFAASIEQMVLQSARLVAVSWDDALLEFLRRVDGSGLHWWLYGSAALAVRGIDVTPGDIDINVNDADLAEQIFEDLLLTPVPELEGWVAKRVGRAFHKATIEWLSELHAEMDDPANPHEQGPYVADQLEIVEWRGHQFRVPPLSAQLATSERRGLDDSVRLIRAAMRP